MIKKLLDSTEFTNRAEQQLTFNAAFERFIKRKYDLKELKNLDTNKITKEYNLKGITFGNYVTQEERYFYLFKVVKQLEALAKLKQSKNLGAAKLIISIGGNGIGGGAAAFYSPKQNLINLARGRKTDYNNFLKGESSFIHEYGHFIDFEQGRRKDLSLNFNFASENKNPNHRNKLTTAYSDLVNICVNDQEYFKKIKHSNYLKSRVEIWARLFDAAIHKYIEMHLKEYSIYFDQDLNNFTMYPSKKIIDLNIDKKCIQILKQSL